jgi:tyrosyl-DNA phosphodiesterase-1
MSDPQNATADLSKPLNCHVSRSNTLFIRQQTQAATEELFYNYELRQTANRLTESDDIRKGVKTFRISEIIGDKTAISFAILSSYSTDIAWLYSFFMPEVIAISLEVSFMLVNLNCRLQ